MTKELEQLLDTIDIEKIHEIVKDGDILQIAALMAGAEGNGYKYEADNFLYKAINLKLSHMEVVEYLKKKEDANFEKKESNPGRRFKPF